MFTNIMKKGTAAALVLATAMTFVAVDNADAGRRYYRGNNGGAVFAGLATGLLVGGIIASQHRRHHRNYYYNDSPRYGYAPRYYAPRYERRYHGPRYGW